MLEVWKVKSDEIPGLIVGLALCVIGPCPRVSGLKGVRKGSSSDI